jgi:DNA-binding CsgD family transcriptional regulator
LSVAPSAERLIGAWLAEDRHVRLLVNPEGDVFWMSAAAAALPAGALPVEPASQTGRLPRLQPLLMEQISRQSDPMRVVLDDPNWMIWARPLHVGEIAAFGLVLRPRGEVLDLTPLAEARQLTRAERRVLSMLLAGEDTPGMAEALDISIETLRTHIKHAYRKLGVGSRGELFAMALDFLQP